MLSADAPEPFTVRDEIPLIEFVYGYPVREIASVQPTAFSAEIFWDESPGAD